MVSPARGRQVGTPEAEPGWQSAAATLRPRVLMVGAHRTKTLGGIKTLIDDLLRSPLAAEFDFLHIASQADECGKVGKLGLALTSLARFILALCWWRPHLVYVHVGGNTSVFRKVPFITLARLCGRRVLTHFHAGDFEANYARQHRLGRRLIRYGLNQSHGFIAVSQHLARLLGRLLPEARISVVPNGVRNAEFAGRCDADDSSVRLLFVGNMGRLKGERDLIRALERAIKVAPEIRVDMLGHGAETMTTLCRESGLWRRVDHLGPVPLEERASFFKRADIFVLPTYAEGMPIAVLEAMAAGLPVITTPVGGVPELVEEGVEGYLVNPGDIDALADRIVRLANDLDQRRRMGRCGRAKARRFDLDLTLKQLGAELRRAAGAACLMSFDERG